MKPRHIVLFAVLVSILSSTCPAVEFPKSRGPVNDFAGQLRPETVAEVTRLSTLIWQKTGVAIVTAVVPDLQGLDREEYANRLYETWGIGDTQTDTGILLLIAVKERKIRIETGYGVEGYLPDAVCRRIGDQYLVPSLKQGDYDSAVRNTVSAIVSVVAEEHHLDLQALSGGAYQSQPRREGKKINPLKSLLLLFIIILLLSTRTGRSLLFLFLLTGGGRGGSSGGGGFGGGFGGGGFGGFGGGSSGGGGWGGSF